jgi:hsp70-interacting protein
MAEPPRHPRNLQDILRLAVENQVERDPEVAGDATSAQAPELSNESQQWLSEALSGMTSDPVVEMNKGMSIISSGLEEIRTNGSSTELEENLIDTMDTLIDYVGSIDYANDFAKLGGTELFKPLLDVESSQIKSKACELLAEIVQNNPQAQQRALESNLLSVLVQRLDTDTNNTVRVKALYAISCLIRDNNDAQKSFDSELDGLSILLRAIQVETEDHKLRIKASFLVTSLCQSQPSVKETLFKMGFVEQLVALLFLEHNTSHEYLLSALNALVTEHEAALVETRRPVLRFRELLQTKLEALRGRPEYSEERYFANNLLQLCFPVGDSPEEER